MSGKKVLIVDDARETGRLIATAISTLDSGLQIKTFATAEEVLVELFSEGADLLVIDVRLPGLSGLELTRRVRARDQAVQIIEISGITDPQVRQQALAAGANAFFPKPISTGDFLHTVAQMLGVKPPVRPEGISPRPKDAKSIRMGDLLSGLRKSLGAALVALINEQGRVVMQTGAWPEPSIEAAILPTLLPALSAGLKVSQQLGTPAPESVLAYRGSTCHLLVAPAGGALAVLVVIRKERSNLRMAIALEELLAVQKDLEKAQAVKTAELNAPAPRVETPVPLAPPMSTGLPVTPETYSGAEGFSTAGVNTAMALAPAVLPPQELADDPLPMEQLAALFDQTNAKRMKPADVDAFWDGATGPAALDDPTSVDVLSYQQATRMGLAPKDSER
ncbi:MAG: response regulator [Anaerolineaceae bacterium]|nr:response regulator [Anaerolineaceae bacterium]